MLNKLYSSLYYYWVKKHYKLMFSHDGEEIYYANKKLVVIQENRILGEKIYDIVSSLSDSNTVLEIKNMSFSFVNYLAVDGVITCFSISVPDEFDVQEFAIMEKLEKVILFVSEMNKHGYFLDESKFEFKQSYSISEILSFLTTDSKAESKTLGILIRYCHYYLSGKNDFEEFYFELDSQRYFDMHEMPYSIEIIQMCYKYYSTGEVPEDIYEVLTYNSGKLYKYDLCVKDAECKNWNPDEENDEYAIYGNIKIFKKMPENFKKFILSDYYDGSICFLCDDTDNLRVINLDGEVIGYETSFDSSRMPILDVEIFHQKMIFKFIEKLISFVLRTKKMRDFDNNLSKVELDKIITVSGFLYDFKFKSFDKLFYFFGMSEDEILNQLAEIFCRMYKKFINKLYGKVNDRNELLEKREIRYLSPMLANELVKFYFEEDTNFKRVFDELQLFNSSYREFDYTALLFYDGRFAYNPFTIPFHFYYEVEQKYGIKLEAHMKKELPDGRNIVMFSHPKSIKDFKNKHVHICEMINRLIGNIESEHLKFVEVSEIIYSEEYDDSGVYSFIGYITTPVKGEILTLEDQLILNNKELMYVFGYYYANFSEYIFPEEYVRMDSDFVFYIDVLADDFELKRTYCSSKRELLKKEINILLDNEYNSNAFVGLNLDLFSLHNYFKDSIGFPGMSLSEYFIELADSLNHYCLKHGIYYAGKACHICSETVYYLARKSIKKDILIFEDDIARHYEISPDYNLKFYKPESVNMIDMEERVDKLIKISLSPNYDLFEYGQDCFIPVKKAYDNDEKFVGYLYKHVSFADESDDLCVDLKDLEKMKNLPRLKALIRLLKQIKSLLEKDIFFAQNPYGTVFLNRSCKKQVQILNIEFIDTEGNKSDIINWTCAYVFDVIKSDKTLMLDSKFKQLLDDIQEDSEGDMSNIDSILLKTLEEKAERMTKYCATHQLYYDKEYLFCPKCSEEVDVENLKIMEISKKDITSRKKIGDGGEADVYEYGNGDVAKVFKENGNINYSLKSIIIARIMKKAETLKNTGNSAQYQYIIPKKILVDNNQMYGYVMKRVGGFPLSVLKDKQFVKEHGFSKRDVFDILITVGKGIEGLHKENIFIGDLNGRNILFNKSKTVYFLDFDGMGVDEFSPEFCTDTYIDPVSKKKSMITEKDDWYSFAVQAFYYLTYTHPFNGIYMEDGRALEIPEKMEKRISLLGNHGIDIPKIAEPWDWMSEELKNTFYSIFEKELRVSIVPYLINQYNCIYKGEGDAQVSDEKRARVNPKFISVRINPFDDENVTYVINSNVAFCKENKYAIVLTSNHKYVLKKAYCFNEPELIQDVVITEDENFAFVIYWGNLFVIDLKKDYCIESIPLIGTNNAIVNGNSIFYVNIHKNMPIISQVSVNSGGELEENRFKYTDESLAPKYFGVALGRKFVIVHPSSNYKDVIYCNSEKFCDIDCKHSNTKYNVIYDAFSKTWLVINEEGYIVIIKQDGTFDKFKLNDEIEVLVKNIRYVKGNIYIPNNGCLWIISVKDQFKCKKMECHKIMTSASRICKVDRNGFTVVTDGKLYVIRRG